MGAHSAQKALDMLRKRAGFSGGLLKTIALLSMTLDHFAVIIIRNGKLYGYSPEYYQMAIATPAGQRWLALYRVFRLLGRLAFPIFAFLLVEGFIHTGDFWKYFRRVFLMALLSELPYDLAFFNASYNFERQNTGFTLACGLLMLYGMKRFRKKPLYKWLSVVLSCAMAELLRFDYGAVAILSIALMYNFRKEKALQTFSGALCSAVKSYESFCLGAAAFLPIFLYNGERGRFHSRWLFYIYYPLHLIVMYLMIYAGSMITS